MYLSDVLKILQLIEIMNIYWGLGVLPHTWPQ